MGEQENRVLRENEYLSVFWLEDDFQSAYVRADVDAETAEKILAMVADAYAAALEMDADKLLENAKYRLVEMPDIQRIGGGEPE